MVVWILQKIYRELVWPGSQAEDNSVCAIGHNGFKTTATFGDHFRKCLCIEVCVCARARAVVSDIYWLPANILLARCTWCHMYIHMHRSNLCSTHANMTRSLQGVRLRHGSTCLTLWLQLCSIWAWNGILSPPHFFPILIKWLPIPEDRVDTRTDC